MKSETKAFIIILLIFITGLCLSAAVEKWLEVNTPEYVNTDVYDNGSQWSDEEWMDIYFREHGEG